jgi:ferredoxin
LTWFEDGEDGVGRLEFDPTGCIACGECAGRCPELALEMLNHGRSDVAARKRILISRGMATCGTCDQPFAPEVGEPNGENFCPACRKSEDLAKTGFALFRAVGPPAEPGNRRVTSS